MNYQVEPQEDKQPNYKDLEELQVRLDGYSDRLYAELKRLNEEKADVERRNGYVKLREDYFKKQEKRLLVVAMVATLFLIMWFAYLELGNTQFGNVVWLSSAGVLGFFLLVNLILYLLDKFGIKKQAARLVLRTLIHILMLPFYFLKVLWGLARMPFNRLLSRRNIKTKNAALL